jgi:hypothetical protein
MSSDEPPPSGTDYHFEAYKLLADMYNCEENAFWPRNQTFLSLNSGLFAILVGILAFQGSQAPPPTSTEQTTTQSAPERQAVPPSPITIQQIVNQPVARSTQTGPRALKLPLVSVSLMSIFLCCLWIIVIKRAEGTNDHLANHMKYLEEKHLADVTNMRMYDNLLTTESDRSRRRWPRFLRDTMSVDELTTRNESGSAEAPRLPRLGSIVRVYDAWAGVAALFMALWAILGGWILFAS